MNLDELRSAQAKERRKDSLQHLRDSFYDDVGAYVADLRAARDRRAEQVDNPFEDDDIRRLSDEVETAEEVAEALYERRVGKVVKLASFAAADMSVDEEGMTTEERRLFDDLVERITANKSEVLDVLAGESPVANGSSAGDEAPGDTAASDAPPAPDRPADRTPESEESPSTEHAEPTGTERTGADPSESPPADAGALAGAMGGDDGESTPDASAESPEGGAAPPAEPGDEADAETTPVPPDPAPPGAVGVGDEEGGTGGPGDADPADVDPGGGADGEPNPGATTDGGAVPETTPNDGAVPETTPNDGPNDGSDDAPEADSGAAASTERATVRITRDVGAIFGVDEREYELASEDVVSLPVENADPLVQRDAAERID